MALAVAARGRLAAAEPLHLGVGMAILGDGDNPAFTSSAENSVEFRVRHGGDVNSGVLLHGCAASSKLSVEGVFPPGWCSASAG